MPRALKVYRTAIGFHDAYVAASSQKTALSAWGTDKDLFARGAAETVTDSALMKAPLAKPGEVIQVMRGSAADHVKALGKGARPKAKPPQTAQPKPRDAKPKRPPKPSREPVRLAKQDVRAAEKRAVPLLANSLNGRSRWPPSAAAWKASFLPRSCAKIPGCDGPRRPTKRRSRAGRVARNSCYRWSLS